MKKCQMLLWAAWRKQKGSAQGGIYGFQKLSGYAVIRSGALHDGKCVYMANVYGRRVFECSSGDYPPSAVIVFGCFKREGNM